MKLTLDRVTLRPANLLVFCLASAAAAFSACATVVEEDPSLTDTTGNSLDSSGNNTLTSNTVGNGIGNTTTINSTSNTVSTSNNSTATSTTSATSTNTDGALGGTITMTVAAVATVNTVNTVDTVSTTATSTSTTGSGIGGAGNTASTGFTNGANNGAGGATTTAVGNTSSMSATTGSNCSAPAWQGAKTGINGEFAYNEGDEVSYMGSIYSADEDMSYVNVECPPVGAASWCSGQGQNWTLVDDC